jgi:hypothetical protein
MATCNKRICECFHMQGHTDYIYSLCMYINPDDVGICFQGHAKGFMFMRSMNNSVKQTKNQRFLAGVQVLMSKNTKKQVKLDKKKKTRYKVPNRKLRREVCVCVFICT